MRVDSTSDTGYWAALALFLVFFSILDILLVVPAIRDFGVNLLTDAIFALFTIVFVDRLAHAREKGSKKVLGREVLRELRMKLYGVFALLEDWLTPKTSPESPGRTTREALRDLSAIEKAELNEKFDEFYFPPIGYPFDYDLEEFLHAGDYFREFDMRFSEFMEPSLRTSLRKIQVSIKSISDNMRIIKENFRGTPTEDVYKEFIAKEALAIIKEINAIDESGFEIRSRGELRETA